ncbi:MAG: sigma factor-like helix-turn-helix DNA-binding protein [Nakamurella sp.]
MAAEIPARRERTASDAAAELGVSVRTVRRIIAEPRDDYTGRAVAHRSRATELRSQGLSYAQIAVVMNLSVGTVGSLIHHARRIARQQDAQEVDIA